GIVTCCSLAVKPVMATFSVQTPGARSANAKLPSAAVMAVWAVVPWVAVTVAPASAMPPPRTTPLSGAARATQARKNSERKTFMIAFSSLAAERSLRGTIDHQHIHRGLASIQFQPQLLRQHGEDRGRRLARLHRSFGLGRVSSSRSRPRRR